MEGESGAIARVKCKKLFTEKLVNHYSEYLEGVFEAYEVEARLSQSNNSDEDQICLKGRHCDVTIVKRQMQRIVKDLDCIAIIKVPYQYREYFLQNHAMVICELELRYGVNIAVSDDCTRPTDIRVQGPKFIVERVHYDITHIIENLVSGNISFQRPILVNPYVIKRSYYERAEIVTESLDISPDFHWILSNRRSELLDKMTKNLSVDITLPTKVLLNRTIEITGFQDNVERAKKEIKYHIQTARFYFGWKRFEMQAEIDSNFIGVAIGRKGDTVRRIKEDYNVGISFRSQEGNKTGVVRIYGEKANVLAAHSEILEMIKHSKENPRLHHLQKRIQEANIIEGLSLASSIKSIREAKGVDSKLVCIKVPFEKDLHPMLLGGFGKELKEFCKNAKLRLMLPAPKDKEQNILRVIGSKKTISETKEFFPSFLNPFTKHRYISITCDCGRYLLEDKRQILNDLEERYNGVKIIIDAHRPRITVSGRADYVEDVKEIVEELADEYERKCQVSTDQVTTYAIRNSESGSVLNQEINAVIRKATQRDPEFDFCQEAETTCQFSGSKFSLAMPPQSEVPAVEKRDMSLFTLSSYGRTLIKRIALIKARRAKEIYLSPFFSKSIPVHKSLHPDLIGKRDRTRREMEILANVISIQYPREKNVAIVTGRFRTVHSCLSHISAMSENLCKDYSRRTSKNEIKLPFLRHLTPEAKPEKQTGRTNWSIESEEEWDLDICSRVDTRLRIKGRKIKKALRGLGKSFENFGQYELKCAIAYKYECRKQIKYSKSDFRK